MNPRQTINEYPYNLNPIETTKEYPYDLNPIETADEHSHDIDPTEFYNYEHYPNINTTSSVKSTACIIL